MNFSAVNDIPVITNLGGDTLNYSEGDGAVVIDQSTNAAVSDVDSADFDTGTLTVSFTAGSDNAEDVLAIRNQGTGAGQIGVSGSNVSYAGTTIGSFTGGSSGTDLVITFNANADATATQALIQNITYENTDTDNPTTGNRNVRYVLTDGDSGTSANYDTTVNFSAVNDIPVITNLGGDTLNYSEGDGAVVIDQSTNAAVSDVDSADFDTGTLTVSFTAGSDSTEDVLAIRNQGTGAGQIGVSGSNVSYAGTTIGSFTGGSSGTDLVITFNANADATATQALIQNITYENTDTDNPTTGNRTVRYVLTDGDGGTSVNYDTTVNFSAVNDVPVITNLGGDTLNYSEGDGAVVIDQSTNAAVSDVDSSNFDTGTLTVSFTAGSDGAEDVLAIRNQGTGAGQIGVSGSNVSYAGTTIGSFTGGSGGTDLVITFNANADATATSALIQNITYENTDTDNPTTGNRTVRYVLTDGDSGTSANYDTTVNFSAVNDVPVITNLGGDTLNYSEGDGVVVIDQSTNAAVSDVDSADFDTGTLTVSFTAGSDNTEDVLAIRNQGTGAGQIGVSGSNASYAGTTIGSFTGGSGGTDLVITLNSNADATATQALIQNITYENTDTDNPTTGNRTVRYVLTDGDGGTSANYDTTVNFSAVNDTPVITNLGGDTLNYSEGDGAVVIDQSTNAAVSDVDSADFDTGTLTVSFTAGSDNAEDVLAIRNQGTGAGQIGVSGSNVSYAGTTIGSFTGGSGGTDLVITLNSNADAAATQALIQNITYENTDTDNPTTGNRTVRYVLTDGDGGTSANYDTTVSFSAVNDIPVITNLGGDTLNYSEGDGAVVIDQSTNAAVSDVDSADFDTGTLTVSFTAGSDSAEDVLAIRNQGTGAGQIGVSGSNVSYAGTTIGSFTGGSGGTDLVITLNSNADATATQALIQNITYENTDTDNPTTGNRTVRYVLTDGDGGTSVNYDTTVNFSAVNDVPVITNLGGDTLNYSEGDGAVVIDQSTNAAVSDVDSSNFDTGTLTVSFTAGSDGAEDVLAIRNQGTGAGQIGVSGSNVSYAGTTIGSFTGGSGGTDLVITFNANADATATSALIQNITYENTDTDNPTTGNRTVRYVLTDGDSGTSANYDTTVNFSAVNDVPVITNLGGDTLNYSEGDGAVVIDQSTNAAVSDVDSADFDTGTLTVSFTAGSDNAEDVLAIRNQGTGAGQIGVSGSNVSYAGTTIGSFTGGSSGTDLVITFNANADATATQALIQNITYENTDTDNPTTGNRNVRYVLTDGDSGTSANYDTTVNFSAVNDIPVITNLGGDTLNYSEGDGAVVIDQSTNAAVSDVDSADFDTGTLTVSFTAGSDSAEDVLAIRNQGTGAGQIGVSGSNVSYAGTTIGSFTGGSGGTDLVITFNANADATATSALIQNMTYENTDTDNPTTGNRTVRYVLTDGDGGTSANYDMTVNFSAINDIPVITNLGGDTLNYSEGDGAVVIDQSDQCRRERCGLQ